MISVLTTNVFSGSDHLKIIIQNLGVQTFKQFEWVLIDAYYNENKELVKELTEKAGLRTVVHVPICDQPHIGHMYNWNCYNNALLLSSNRLFLRLGVHRYFHNKVVETAVELAGQNKFLNLRQRNVDSLSVDSDNINYHKLEDDYKLETLSRIFWKTMNSQCGMFSFDKSAMIEMNGNNEALLIHHWEDIDLNCRWTQHSPVDMVSLENAFLRVYHDKSSPYMEKKVCTHTDNPDCIVYAKNSHELENYPTNDIEWIYYRDFKWARCKKCKTVAVSYCDKYFDYLKTNKKGYLAPINVGGVGRDIRIVNEDIKKLSSLQDKVELLTASHTNPRYLVDTV